MNLFAHLIRLKSHCFHIDGLLWVLLSYFTPLFSLLGFFHYFLSNLRSFFVMLRWCKLIRILGFIEWRLVVRRFSNEWSTHFDDLLSFNLNRFSSFVLNIRLDLIAENHHLSFVWHGILLLILLVFEVLSKLHHRIRQISFSLLFLF